MCYSNSIETEVQKKQKNKKMIVDNRIIMVVFQKVDSTLTDDLTGRTTEKPGF